MKTNLAIFLISLMGLFACESSELSLIKNGNTNYEIVIPDDADNNEVKSANELQKYLQLKTGVKVSIFGEGQASSDYRIWIGNTTQGQSLKALEYDHQGARW